MLNGGNEIILAIWTNNKHIECSINNDIPVRIPSFPYVLLNGSALSNCEIETVNHFPLEPLAACQELESKFIMYFTVNLAFVIYFDNLTKSLGFSILLNRTTEEQFLPISLETFDFEPELLKAPKTLKDLFNQITHKQEIFDLQERHTIKDLEMAKNFFLIIIQ